MLPTVALALCAIEIIAAHFMDLSHEEYAVVFQLYIAVLCFGAIVSNGSHRDRAIMFVLFGWNLWILATDQFGLDLPDYLMSFESAMFTSFVLWAIYRPYFFTSDAISKRNVCIYFYKGTNGPILSSIAALFGLPFSSIAIVARGKALRPSKSGYMIISDATAMSNSHDFVCVDTRVVCTDDIYEDIGNLIGKSTKYSGFFRAKCVSNIAPILSKIGYTPKNIFRRIPSIYYYQCVRQANG